jgi:hypothetical protein
MSDQLTTKALNSKWLSYFAISDSEIHLFSLFNNDQQLFVNKF